MYTVKKISMDGGKYNQRPRCEQQTYLVKVLLAVIIMTYLTDI